LESERQISTAPSCSDCVGRSLRVPQDPLDYASRPGKPVNAVLAFAATMRVNFPPAISIRDYPTTLSCT
jgi:hypothetical protein